MRLKERQAPLAPEWYWKPEWLERERERVFRTNWIFAGLKQEVSNPNDYLSFTVAGVPVVIRNMRGTLTAFKNICSHRHALIHPAGTGNAMFRCPFHGWTYDASGVPVGIPENTRAFGFDRDDRCALALDKVQIETCGNFIFVRLAPDGPPLIDWLGQTAERLEYISTFFDGFYSKLEADWRSNWKLGIEITADNLHVPFVHPSSFVQHIDNKDETPPAPSAQAGREPYGKNEYVGKHSYNCSPLSPAALEHLLEIARNFQVPVSSEMRDYDHFLIYPNLMIGVSGGVTVCIEQYEPVAAEKTRNTCWLMMAKPREPAVREQILWQTQTQQMHDWTARVLDEDRAICENVQTGLRHATCKGYLGKAEERVAHLQSALLAEVTP